VAKDFRFGIGLFAVRSREKWRDHVRRADDFGYDVLQVPDHLGAPAPFPALLSAAEVTSM
jgi:alkanesulfonate monooxygenase SsuD/methylene tetrahydromethanopterin reductase-like flavin-dependent oxidoreductase (luciferase family)